MGSIIYTPKGKAREYSPLAVNLYNGCNHGCKYCYVPRIRFWTREQFLKISPRKNILKDLEKDCKKYVGSKDQVFFSFMTDPYNEQEMELGLMRDSLKLMLKYKIPVTILTKSGDNVFRDIDVIKKFGPHIMLGASLTFADQEKSIKWEPYAATPRHRIEMLEKAKSEGIKTWVSIEPVIEPEESIKIIQDSMRHVDFFKIGKLNNFEGLDKKINWHEFLEMVVNLLRAHRKPFYIKEDLRKAAPEIKLYGNEVLMDEFNLPAFESEQMELVS